MSSRFEKKKLKLVIDGFLQGNSTQFRIIKNKITQYIYHQRFGEDRNRDELVSEVIEALYNNLKKNSFKGDTISALNVYIYRIIKFKISKVLRRREKLTYKNDGFETLASKSESLDEQLSNKQLVDKIFRTINAKCAELLKLKFLEQWTDEEIAEHVKKSKNATSTAITRCVQKVKEYDFIKTLL